MKIKKSKTVKKSTNSKYANGGFMKYDDGGWNNLNTAQAGTTVGNLGSMGNTGSVGNGQITAFGQSQSKGDYLNASLNGVMASSDTIVNYSPDSTKLPGHGRNVENYNKFTKASTSTGTKVGRGIGIAALNFIPVVGPLVSSLGSKGVDAMVAKRKSNLYDKATKEISLEKQGMEGANAPVDQLNSQQVQFANGGFEPGTNSSTHLLEKYKLNKHSELNPNFANAQLDGKPIQMEKNETIFRAANGGDYAFSPNLKADDGFMKYGDGGNKTRGLTESWNNLNTAQDGNKTFAEKSIEIENKHKKPYFDKVAQDTTKLALNDLVKKNEASRVIKEKQEFLKSKGGNAPFTNEYPRLYDFNNQEEPVEIQTKTPNLLQTNLTPQTSTITKYPTVSVTKLNKPKTGLKNDLTTGDWLQVAGGLPSLGYNLARAFEKPEKQHLYTDSTSINPQQIAKDYTPLFLAENAANADIDNSTSSDAVRRANRVALTSNTQRNAGEYSLNVDNANKSLRMQFEDRLSGQNKYNNAQRLLTDDINSQNKAATRAFGAAAATQLGQNLTSFGIAKNQGKTNEIEYAALQDIAANYGLDPKEYADFLKSKGVKIKYR